MPWIFNYAELGPQNIESLLNHAPFVSLPASTPNSKMVFKGKSRKWTGSLATLEKSKGNWVYGSALLLPEDELPIFDKYHQNYNRINLPILIDATKDKVQAISYILDPNSPVGQPSEDYIKEILKHLKFFWGQGDSKTLSLENFGITTTPAISTSPLTIPAPAKVKKEKAPLSAEAVKNLLSDIAETSTQVKNNKKRTKAQ